MEYKHCVNARTEAQSSYNSIMRQKYHISPDFMASSINVRRHHANLASSVIATFRHDPLALGVIKVYGIPEFHNFENFYTAIVQVQVSYS